MKTELLNLNNQTIEYSVLGEGKPLLFLPGANVEHTYYEQFLAKLAKSFKVYSFSYAGYGKSSKVINNSKEGYIDTITSFCNHFELKNLNLVGHSLGGGLSLIYSSVSNNVRRICVLNPLVAPINKNLVQILSGMFKNSRQDSRTTSTVKYSVLSLIKDMDIFSHGLKTSTRLNQIKILQNFNIDEVLPIIKIPVLAIISEDDPILDSYTQDKNLHLIPKVELIKYERGGHGLFYSREDAMVGAINEFLNR